jgi:outer membrane protein assembly factor BamA
VKHLGESLKSSLTFSFASTAFEDNPKAAGSTVTSVEVGGIGTNGPCQFIKGSISSHLSFELTETSELNIEGTMGVILPSKWGSSANIGPCDRFFMGGLGPYGLRGFHQHGVGPMSARRKDGLPKVRQLN